jgi:hypothetical protein
LDEVFTGYGVITTHLQQIMKPAMGVPESYSLSEAEQLQVSDSIRSVLPIKLRTAGFVFDMFTSNVDMDQHPAEYPMESIRIPCAGYLLHPSAF